MHDAGERPAGKTIYSIGTGTKKSGIPLASLLEACFVIALSLFNPVPGWVAWKELPSS